MMKKEVIYNVVLVAAVFSYYVFFKDYIHWTISCLILTVALTVRSFLFPPAKRNRTFTEEILYEGSKDKLRMYRDRLVVFLNKF